VLPSCEAVPTTVHVSYNMNRLQRLDAPQTYVVTLNGDDRIDPHAVIDRMSYEHPVYTTASVAARERLPELNDGVLAFAGAYHGWGFHEDGCRSGVAAAASLGVRW
jgi:predicted NAD/FAD-binding protein